ncbi:LysR family transcriptional regulator [Bacillus sp. CMF21]|uniref:LysR family transcriptional regulator n=1 Tax=Metabacillus dongyingensis TaxID=2874282 RepID=UPI001CBBB16A|nr:LysR family transcriptional regulator [Metabacillus dongyingensis]UAL54633.1 LysR family transcriptional regulator [Metabacillus dongyingensis]UOK59771.1 LysR family transcriptional regulator [Bacillus sp. OVS6]USK30950.1 LysR family transcriptional regulator [Bacillus sp. CMF21]
MESHDLRIFKHVAELQSVSKAAEKLGYVQPNVSQRIKVLEDELGVRLFIRNNRGVSLTEEGSVLLEYTNQIILLMDEAKSLVNPKKWRGSLTIGASQTISAVRIPKLFSSFLREHKNIDVKVRTNDKQKLQEMLSYGELDGVFINGTYNYSQFEIVYSYFEKIVLISPKHSQFEKQHDQTLIVNSDTNCIYRNKTLDIFKESNFHDLAIMEFDSLESILQAVHDGLGISIIPADVANIRKEIQTIQYKELSETIKIDFIIKHRKQQPQSLKKFIHFLQRT